MKTSLIALMLMLSSVSMAALIEGTLMLKGQLKTKIVVDSVKTVCKFKVEKVKNILEEDSFGNPGYQAKVQISLDGSDFERSLKVKLEKDITVINMHTVGNQRQVKDLEYFNTAE